MYEVQWQHEALDQLHEKVRTHPVRTYLLEVARSSLDRHFPVWGGRALDLLWRRGLTEQDEKELEQAEHRGVERDGAKEHARDFVLVYTGHWTRRRERLYQVVGVYTNAEVAGVLRTRFNPRR